MCAPYTQKNGSVNFFFLGQNPIEVWCTHKLQSKSLYISSMGPKKDEPKKPRGRRVFTPEQREHRRQYQATYREERKDDKAYKASESERTGVSIVEKNNFMKKLFKIFFAYNLLSYCVNILDKKYVYFILSMSFGCTRELHMLSIFKTLLYILYLHSTTTNTWQR